MARQVSLSLFWLSVGKGKEAVTGEKMKPPKSVDRFFAKEDGGKNSHRIRIGEKKKKTNSTEEKNSRLLSRCPPTLSGSPPLGTSFWEP